MSVGLAFLSGPSRAPFQVAAGTILAIALGCAAGTEPVLAQDKPPPDVLLTRSLPATIAKRRLEQPAISTPMEQAKVIGGKDAARGQFKWQVAVIRSEAAADYPFGGFFCGASLVAWRWVLTAAHCTYEDNPGGTHLPAVAMAPGSVHVYLGSHDFTGGQRILVKRIIRHERYDRDSKDNDLALFELEAEPQEKSQLALLPPLAANDDPPIQPGRRVSVLGWGSTAPGVIPMEQRRSVQVLQYVDSMQFKRSDLCNLHHLRDTRARYAERLKEKGWPDSYIRTKLDDWYPSNTQLISDNMICAGTNDGSKDACFGDSGGPLVVTRESGLVQAGIVSWGPGNGCGLTDLYGIYTRLPRYLDWIAGKIN